MTTEIRTNSDVPMPKPYLGKCLHNIDDHSYAWGIYVLPLIEIDKVNL